MTIIIGTRGSDLALTQAKTVATSLKAILRIDPEIRIIHTQGDRITDRPLRELEGRGYFTKEIEEALLRREIDVAVHSFKDMPSRMPDGLALAAVTAREDAADLLIIQPSAFSAREKLPLRDNAIVGTSAVRRETQLRALRPDLQIHDLRGNVPTRIRKLTDGQFDAILLAAAGTNRLGLDLSMLEVVRLEPSSFVPAPGQGALAIQVRANEPRIDEIHLALHDAMVETATKIERRVQARFGGGCGLPLGVHARMENDRWSVYGFWGDDPECPVWQSVHGDEPLGLADELYEKLTSKAKCESASS